MQSFSRAEARSLSTWLAMRYEMRMLEGRHRFHTILMLMHASTSRCLRSLDSFHHLHACWMYIFQQYNFQDGVITQNASVCSLVRQLCNAWTMVCIPHCLWNRGMLRLTFLIFYSPNWMSKLYDYPFLSSLDDRKRKSILDFLSTNIPIANSFHWIPYFVLHSTPHFLFHSTDKYWQPSIYS